MRRFYLYHPDLKAPVLIKHDPVGWDTLGKTAKRDMKWGGMFFEYTPELKWVKDGRKFIQYYRDKYGFETVITMMVYEYNPSTRKWDLDYTGRLNLTKLRITRLYAICNSEQTGFTQTVINGQEKKVEHVTESLNVMLPKKVITQKFARDKQARTIPEDWDGDNEYNLNETVSENLLYWKSLQNGNTGNQPEEGVWWTEISREELGLPVCSFFASAGQTWYILPAFGDDEVSDNEITKTFRYGLQATQDDPVEFLKYFWLLEFDCKATFVIHSFIRLFKGASLTGTFEMILKYGRQDNYTTIVVSSDTDMATDIHISEGNENATLKAGDQVYIYYKFHITSMTGVHQMIFVEDYVDLLAPIPANFTTVITFDAATTFRASSAPVNLMHDCFKATVEKITGKTGVFKSDYYGLTDSVPAYTEDGEGGLRGIMNGKHIRGFPRVDNKLYTNLKELIEVGQCVDGIGVGIEKYNQGERVVVEPMPYFFKKTRIAQLPNVRDIEKVSFSDHIFNMVIAGYDKTSKDGIGNTDDFTGKRELSLPITQLQNTNDLVSPYHASPYLIEQLRRDAYAKSKTKSTDLDNDNFIIQLFRAGDGLRVELGSDFGTVLFVDSPSSLCNVRLSPMRNVLRNGSMIRTGLDKREGEPIEIIGYGNTGMWSKLPTETEYVKENSLAITDLKPPFIWADGYIFKAPLTRAQLQAINDDPTGYIEFAGDASAWKRGYIIKMEPSPKSLLTEFTLIRANL